MRSIYVDVLVVCLGNDSEAFLCFSAYKAVSRDSKLGLGEHFDRSRIVYRIILFCILNELIR